MFQNQSASTVLYIDDNDDDRTLIQQAAESTRVALNFACLRGVNEGIAYLTGRGPFVDRTSCPSPAFILLDYHLDGRTGPEFISWLRATPELTGIPVCVYSDADRREPIADSYRAGAALFLVKPRSFDRLQALVRALNSCASFVPPSFNPLRCLPEHRCRPVL